MNGETMGQVIVKPYIETSLDDYLEIYDDMFSSIIKDSIKKENGK